jgi:hypothetical protein
MQTTSSSLPYWGCRSFTIFSTQLLQSPCSMFLLKLLLPLWIIMWAIHRHQKCPRNPMFIVTWRQPAVWLNRPAYKQPLPQGALPQCWTGKDSLPTLFLNFRKLGQVAITMVPALTSLTQYSGAYPYVCNYLYLGEVSTPKVTIHSQ